MRDVTRRSFLKSVGFGAASFGALSLVGSSSVSAGKKKRPNIILFPHVAGSMIISVFAVAKNWNMK